MTIRTYVKLFSCYLVLIFSWQIQGVFKRFAKDFGQDFLALQRDVIWPLYDKYEELFEVLVGITTKEVSDR
jgi:hypothetical protein